MATDWTENIILTPEHISSPPKDISSPPGENRIDSSPKVQQPVLSNEYVNLNENIFDATVNTSNPQEKKKILKQKYQDPQFEFDFPKPKNPKLEKPTNSSPNQTLVSNSKFTLSESADVSKIEINIDSSPPKDVCLPPEDISLPPKDISSPPEDPPEDISSPPEDISSPPEDIFSPPEDNSMVITIDTEQPFYTESIWTCLNTRESYVPCLVDLTKLKEKCRESDSSNEEKNIQKSTKKLRRNCTQCDETFSNVGNLNRHVQRIHENKKFSCTNCDNVFGTQRNLDCHFNDKHAENPTIYTCDFCGQEWKHAVMFKKHKNCSGNMDLKKKKPKKN